MGHLQFGKGLPNTPTWQQVIRLIAENGTAAEIATATLTAARGGLQRASNDAGLVQSVWLLTQVVQAARKSNFIDALKDVGISVPENANLTDLLSGVSKAIDSRLPNNRGRTDLGEIAQMSAVEALSRLCASEVHTLFGTGPSDLKNALYGLSTTKGFSRLAHEFFSRLVYRYLSSFLSLELSNHVGEGRRFISPEEHLEFLKGVELNSRRVAAIVEVFAEGWYGKALRQGEINPRKVAGFVSYAIEKLKLELVAGGEEKGE